MGNSKDQGLRQVEELVRKNMDTTQYDPEQPEEERRQLRIRYRDLQEQTFGKKEMFSHPQRTVLIRLPMCRKET